MFKNQDMIYMKKNFPNSNVNQEDFTWPEWSLAWDASRGRERINTRIKLNN